MSKLTPFKINTSRNFRDFCIPLICGKLKSTRINTSMIFDFKPSRINTSTKTGGRGVQLQLVATGDGRASDQDASPERSEGSLRPSEYAGSWRRICCAPPARPTFPPRAGYNHRAEVTNLTFRRGAKYFAATIALAAGLLAIHWLTATPAASKPIAAAAVPLSAFMRTTQPAPEIAFTFDYLPAHGPLPPGETRMDVITKIIAALREAGLPPAYGFVNGVRNEEEPGDAAVLEAWRAAGNPLGNHTWSHMYLNQSSLENFEQDFTRNEPSFAPLMKDEDWRWFRFPYLAEGDTPQKKMGFRTFLRQHDYKIAAVTMSFGDYLWNDPYARCKAKGDAAAIATLETSYLAAAAESIDYDRSMSRTLYQRDIPYVLLMHVGAFDGEMLPRLLELYKSKGFVFVTLPDAERDDFYRDAIDVSLPPGPETLEGAMGAQHLPLPARTNFAAQLDSLCR